MGMKNGSAGNWRFSLTLRCSAAPAEHSLSVPPQLLLLQWNHPGAAGTVEVSPPCQGGPGWALKSLPTQTNPGFFKCTGALQTQMCQECPDPQTELPDPTCSSIRTLGLGKPQHLFYISFIPLIYLFNTSFISILYFFSISFI